MIWLSGCSARMISEIDIYRAANILVKRYGEDASLEADPHADRPSEPGTKCPTGKSRL